jgi:tRNA (guanosine-2'-O-)-methyltransferase
MGIRERANKAKELRCKTLTCVLENPKSLINIGSVIRNIDTLGVGNLYIIDGFNLLSDSWEKIRTNKELTFSSVSANKWTYIKKFKTTSECFEHLKKKNYVSFCTSPHIKGQLNFNLYSGKFTQKHLAIWFGNETRGVTQEVIDKSQGCIQIEMSGIIESLNLACSTSIVLWYISQKRREFIVNKNLNYIKAITLIK